MNTPVNPMDTSSPSDAPLFNPFPEPQTMPKGWDFSGLMPADRLPAVKATWDEAEA